MVFYSYVIPRDFGFAPNPYFGYCTLATCKQQIRKTARVGDWVGAFGAARTAIHQKLVFLMLVKETMTFDEYWQDPRFRNKRPTFNKSIMFMYGDNIYHHMDGQWTQEPSHHSKMDGSINYDNLNRDTSADRVLIAEEFYYFGCNAIDMPLEFLSLIYKNIGYKKCTDEELINNFVQYIRQNCRKGVNGIPYSRRNGVFTHYRGTR